MLFKERAKLALEKLAKQPPVSYEQKKAQILKVKLQSEEKKAKKRFK